MKTSWIKCLTPWISCSWYQAFREHTKIISPPYGLICFEFWVQYLSNYSASCFAFLLFTVSRYIICNSSRVQLLPSGDLMTSVNTRCRLLLTPTRSDHRDPAFSMSPNMFPSGSSSTNKSPYFFIADLITSSFARGFPILILFSVFLVISAETLYHCINVILLLPSGHWHCSVSSDLYI